MGRKSKGDRHKIIRCKPEAAALSKRDTVSLGCRIGDYIGWLVCRHVDVPMNCPIGGSKTC